MSPPSSTPPSSTPTNAARPPAAGSGPIVLENGGTAGVAGVADLADGGVGADVSAELSAVARVLTPPRALLLVAVAAAAAGLWLRRPVAPPPPAPCPHALLQDGRLRCLEDGAAAPAGDDDARGYGALDVGDRGWLVGEKLDLNTATARSLARIPGVGPGLAARLIAARDARGGFSSFDEVDAVPGVGPRMMEKLRAATEVRPATAPAPLGADSAPAGPIQAP